jgi:pimeloyl-ACP methyl ester carboxylesterase
LIPLPGSTEQFSAADGTALAVRRWAGTEPNLIFVHANGFSKELWEPTLVELDRRDIDAAGAALDQRGHGDSGGVAAPIDLGYLGTDAADILAHLRRDGRIGEVTIGVGHSSGGTAVAMAAVDDDEAFGHLVLIEPIIFPPPYERLETNPMTAAALRRRASVPDRATAVATFTGRGPFAAWRTDAVEAYVDGAMEERGGELVLKCAPETEAEIYRAGLAVDTWAHLDAIACPVTLIVGDTSTTHNGAYLSDLAARFGEVELLVVPGASHLVPMERPDIIADAIAAAIIDLADRGVAFRR